MKQWKIIVVLLVLGALTVGGLWAQKGSSGSSKAVRLSKQDMELLVSELIPPQQQQQIAADPEKKKDFVKRVKRFLALAEAARQEKYQEKPEIKSMIEIEKASALSAEYSKKHPGEKVSEEEINAYHQANPSSFEAYLQANPQAQGPQADRLKQQYGEVMVMGNKARQEGLDQDPATKIRLMFAENDVLVSKYVDDLGQRTDLVSDADIEKYYSENASEFEEVKARHILISTRPGDADPHGATGGKPAAAPSKEEARKKAQAILERIRKGEDFAKLAQENSEDPGSKTNGGDLGYFTRGQLVKPFEDTAFGLKAGEVSDIVETDFGFHIIKVEDRRSAPLDDPKTREAISQQLKQKKIEEIADNPQFLNRIEVAEDFSITPKQPQMQLPGGHPPTGPAAQ